MQCQPYRLGLTLNSLVSSFTSRRVETTAADRLSMRTVRNVTRELPGTSLGDFSKWNKNDVWCSCNYDASCQVVCRWRFSEVAKRNGGDGWEKLHMINPGANGLVIPKSIFGEGAERVVYAMREAVIDTKENI